ncbi:uncharacterized protein MONOS_6716 [Monocercomonoides exilis]|uniref:uncharacterized protein n=1 Tax=Monocercomonoides exilis TaxID=2049356 RepID=UPI00355A1A92|nr:hypothetical protein MONOS_6716 [Monocercomonoides exilis]|eukprot:MONOS_6716.1-p1 / transcript=MONOS_6716.1 / gene=MONOS_6716 / organism=Monocercomonoides_exilis_PA203 / gene_product=unspecified product / transcript_product=unspecified product / location=Mono_scaffold00216:64054-69924(-) / protein_length=1899 / sequence_SO=supercontig / SO=protein_coding / is_pseudo=false
MDQKEQTDETKEEFMIQTENCKAQLQYELSSALLLQKDFQRVFFAKDEELTKLRKELEDLKANYNSLQESCDAARKSAEEMKQEKENVEILLSATKNELQQTKENSNLEINNLQQKCQTIEQQRVQENDESNQKIIKLSEELEKASQTASKALEVNRELTSMTMRFEQEKSEYLSQLNILTGSNEDLTRRISELGNALSAANETIMKLKGESLELAEKLKKEESRSVCAENELEKQRFQQSELSSAASTSNGNISSNETLQSTIMSQLHEAELKNQQLRSELNVMKLQMDKLAEENTQRNNELTTVKSECEQLGQQKTALEVQLTEASQVIHVLKEEKLENAGREKLLQKQIEKAVEIVSASVNANASVDNNNNNNNAESNSEGKENQMEAESSQGSKDNESASSSISQDNNAENSELTSEASLSESASEKSGHSTLLPPQYRSLAALTAEHIRLSAAVELLLDKEKVGQEENKTDSSDSFQRQSLLEAEEQVKKLERCVESWKKVGTTNASLNNHLRREIETLRQKITCLEEEREKRNEAAAAQQAFLSQYEKHLISSITPPSSSSSSSASSSSSSSSSLFTGLTIATTEPSELFDRPLRSADLRHALMAHPSPFTSHQSTQQLTTSSLIPPLSSTVSPSSSSSSSPSPSQLLQKGKSPDTQLHSQQYQHQQHQQQLSIASAIIVDLQRRLSEVHQIHTSTIGQLNQQVASQQQTIALFKQKNQLLELHTQTMATEMAHLKESLQEQNKQAAAESSYASHLLSLLERYEAMIESKAQMLRQIDLFFSREKREKRKAQLERDAERRKREKREKDSQTLRLIYDTLVESAKLQRPSSKMGKGVHLMLPEENETAKEDINVQEGEGEGGEGGEREEEGEEIEGLPQKTKRKREGKSAQMPIKQKGKRGRGGKKQRFVTELIETPAEGEEKGDKTAAAEEEEEQGGKSDHGTASETQQKPTGTEKSELISPLTLSVDALISARHASLLAKVEELTKSLKDATQKAEEAAEKQQELKIEMEELTKAKDGLQKTMEEEKQVFEKEKEEMAKQVEDKTQELKRLQAEFDSVIKEGGMSQTVDALRESIREKEEEKLQLTLHYAEEKAEMEKSFAEEKGQMAQQMAEKMEETRKECEEKTGLLMKQIEELQKELAETAEKLSKVEEELREAKTEKEKVFSTLTHTTAQVDEEKEQKDMFLNEIRLLKENFAAAQGRIQEMAAEHEAKVKEDEARLTEMSTVVESLNGDIKQKEEEAMKLRQEIETLNSKLSDAVACQKDEMRQHGMTLRRLEEAEQERNRLEGEVEEMKRRMTLQKKEAEEGSGEMQEKQIDMMKQVEKENAQKIEQQEKKLAELTSALEDKEKECVRWKQLAFSQTKAPLAVKQRSQKEDGSDEHEEERKEEEEEEEKVSESSSIPEPLHSKSSTLLPILMSQIDAMESQLSLLKMENQRLSSALELRSQQVPQPLRTDAQIAAAQNAQLTQMGSVSKVNAYSSSSSSSSSESDLERIQLLSESNKTLRSDKQNLEKKLISTERKLNEMEKEMQKMQNELTIYKKSAEEAAVLRVRVEELTKKISALSGELEEMGKKLGRKELELKEKEFERMNERKQKEKEKRLREEEKGKFEAERKEREEKLRESEANAGELQKTLSAKEAELKRLNETKLNYEEELANKNEVIRKKEAELAEAMKKMEAAEKELKVLTASSQQHGESIQKHEAEKASYEKTIQELNAQLSMLKEEKEKIEGVEKRRNGELAEAQGKLARASELLQRMTQTAKRTTEFVSNLVKSQTEEKALNKVLVAKIKRMEAKREAANAAGNTTQKQNTEEKTEKTADLNSEKNEGEAAGKQSGMKNVGVADLHHDEKSNAMESDEIPNTSNEQTIAPNLPQSASLDSEVHQKDAEERS